VFRWPILIALAQSSNSDLAAATDTLRVALAKFPDTARVYAELGRLLGAQRLYDEAAGIYEDGLSINSTHPGLLKGASVVAQRRGVTTQAASYARRLVERPNPTVNDYLWLAAMDEQVTPSDPTRAVDLAANASRLSPEVGQIRDTLAWAHFNAGNEKLAQDILSELVLTEDAKPITFYRYGRVLISVGDSAAAKPQLEMALSLDPDAAFAVDARELLSKLAP